jgi:hypothetical protein
MHKTFPNKILAAAIFLTASSSSFAAEPDYMVIAKAGLNCSVFQDGEYLCQTSVIGSPDAASDALILSYQDIINMGGKSFVPVVSYQVAYK